MKNPCWQKLAAGTAIIASLSACGQLPSETSGRTADPIEIEFRLVPQTDILEREGLAIRDKTDAPAGNWGVIPGLRRSELATVENLSNGKSVTVALYAGSVRSADAIIRLSPQASDVLEIPGDPVPVRVVAVRREPVLVNR